MPGAPQNVRLASVLLYVHGLSINAIARPLDYTPSAVLRWIKVFGRLNYFKPEPISDAVVLEIDEMHHYLKKSNKVWIWKAYCRDSGQLVDWELGGRDANTFARLKAQLDKWKVRLICIDAYNVYDEAYKPDKHCIGKNQTYRIEQNNSRQRHWFARFRRKSILVSRSLEMIELTMALFAAFHVNKTASFSASLIC